MRILNSNLIQRSVLWGGVIACYTLTLITFIAIAVSGSITYYEPNSLILFVELVFVIVLGFLILNRIVEDTHDNDD